MHRSTRTTFLSALVVSVLPVGAAAHHSFAAHFLMDTFVEVEGRVTDVDWVNPHIKIHVEDANGEAWEIEAGPVNLLSRMGIDRDAFTVGETIRARGNPGRRNAQAILVANILLADNTEILAAPGMPFAMMSPYPIELIDRGDHIEIRGEAYDLEGVAWLEPPETVPAPSPLGYSVARVEDDTIMIDTTRIDYHSYGDLGPAQSDQSHVVERFTLVDGGLELEYEITVTDPVMLAEPWLWGGSFVAREDAELRAWNCGSE